METIEALREELRQKECDIVMLERKNADLLDKLDKARGTSDIHATNHRLAVERHDEQMETLQEMLQLTTMAGRRCTYDLKHAARTIEDSALAEIFLQRYEQWIRIFNPMDGPKNYRHRLHLTIMELENEVNRIRELVDPETLSEYDASTMDNQIPF